MSLKPHSLISHLRCLPHATKLSGRFIRITWFLNRSTKSMLCPLAQALMGLKTTKGIPCILTLRVWKWLPHPKQCSHQPKIKDVVHVCISVSNENINPSRSIHLSVYKWVSQSVNELVKTSYSVIHLASQSVSQSVSQLVKLFSNSLKLQVS